MSDPTLAHSPSPDHPPGYSMTRADETAGAGVSETLPPTPTRGREFELLEEVGRGGMGVVYRARDLLLDREVAVKILREEFKPGSLTGRRFLEEARITARLQHPGIPAVYHVGDWPDGRPFLAMKLVRGHTLDERLAAEGADATRWLGAFESLCHALGYAHAEGIVHRDLKPANVMVGAFGEVQVMDWGLAKVLADGEQSAGEAELGRPSCAAAESDGSFTRAGSVFGTPAYMPPEQAVGAVERVDRRSDVFGLGAILCTLLTGEPPYRGESAEELLVRAARGDTADAFRRLDACGAEPDVVALCKSCLALNPAARPADGNAVATEVARIRTAADERAKQAEFERARAEVRAAEQRKRRRTVLVAVCVLAAVLGLGVVGTAFGLARAERKRGEAEAAETEARRLGGVAERERARAAARLGKAVEAIEKTVTRAGTGRWARDRSLAAERRQILEDAVAFYESFGESDDPVVRRETARSYRRIGEVYLHLGEYARAADYLKRARAICESLAAEFPDDPAHTADLAEARLFLAHEAATAGRAGEARDCYRDAVEAARKASAARPADEETRRTLVSCLLGYGFISMQTGGASEPLFAEALREAEALLARPNAPFSTRALAAYTVTAAATLDFTRGRIEEGATKVRRAAAMAAETPPDPSAPAHYQSLLDTTRGAVKMTEASLLMAADPKRAAAMFREAAGIFDDLLAIYPKSLEYRIYKVFTLAAEHQVLMQFKRTEEAQLRQKEMLATAEDLLQSSPNLGVVKQLVALHRSSALVESARAGDVSDLDRKVDELLELAPDNQVNAVVRYNAACALSVGSRHGTSDDQNQRATRAVKILCSLIDSPFLQRATAAAHIGSDPDLDPLRNRTDFKEFLARLRKKNSPAPAAAPPPRPKG